jgi:NAD+ diphosphatase
MVRDRRVTFTPSVKAPVSAVAGTESIWFAIGKRGLLVRRSTDSGSGSGWVLPAQGDLEDLGVATSGGTFFGHTDETATFAVTVDDDLKLGDGYSMLGLRALVEAFDEETFAIAGRAAHVLDWATTSRFCGRCGTRTERVETEWCRRCPACALAMYPRIAPAIIVLVRRGDEALLARNARFPLPFYSTLAGFSDIGETLEQTLAREVFEEVGVRVKSVRYFGSQPWPFPNSLMVGFTAEWESGDIKVDAIEIADAKWFSAGELPLIPPSVSIARRLIDAWVADVAAGR